MSVMARCYDKSSIATKQNAYNHGICFSLISYNFHGFLGFQTD